MINDKIMNELTQYIKTYEPTNEELRYAKILIFDAVGVACAAATPPNIPTKAATRAFNNIQSDLSNINAPMSTLHAAMSAAMLTHALDFDDTNTESIVHASAILTPICLILAPHIASTKDISHLSAFIVGHEIAHRIGIASCGTFHKRGFHTTSIAGVFGAAACICRLMGLDQGQISNALGLAGSMAGGVNEFLADGSDSKLVHVSNCVNSGIYAAYMAMEGLRGPSSIFTGRDNIFKAFGKECALSELTRNLSQDSRILKVSIKPYPACHFAHGFIECAINMRAYKEDEIKEVHCFVDEVPASFICGDDKWQPKSIYEAKFSLPFLMALAYIDGGVNLNNLSGIDRLDVLRMANKVSYEIRSSPEFPHSFPGHIEVKLSNGNISRIDVPINKGHFKRPLSEEEIKGKFKDNTGITKEEVDELFNELMNDSKTTEKTTTADKKTMPNEIKNEIKTTTDKAADKENKAIKKLTLMLLKSIGI